LLRRYVTITDMSKEKNTKKKICMIVPNRMVMGGIAAVVNGYPTSSLEINYDITYVESYCDGGKIKKLLKALKGYAHYIYVLLYDTPDLVHIHSSFGPSFYRKMPFIDMAFRAGIPIVNHIHGADFDTFFVNASPKKKALIKKNYQKCNRIIALSSEWKDRLCQIVSSDKIDIIPNYSKIMLEENKINDNLYKEKSRYPYILFLGELGQRKGCFDLPKVAIKVWEKNPNISFVLGGVGNAEDVALIKEGFICGAANIIDCDASTEAVLDRLEAIEERKVIFPGWVRNEAKEILLKNAYAFILPSYNEGLPMSVLDAMGYGLPIISTDVGGIPKIVKNSENGYCLSCADTDKMAEAILEIVGDTQKAVTFGQNSIKIIKEGFSLDSHIRKISECYEKALSDK